MFCLKYEEERRPLIVAVLVGVVRALSVLTIVRRFWVETAVPGAGDRVRIKTETRVQVRHKTASFFLLPYLKLDLVRVKELP